MKCSQSFECNCIFKMFQLVDSCVVVVDALKEEKDKSRIRLVKQKRKGPRFHSNSTGSVITSVDQAAIWTLRFASLSVALRSITCSLRFKFLLVVFYCAQYVLCVCFFWSLQPKRRERKRPGSFDLWLRLVKLRWDMVDNLVWSKIEWFNDHAFTVTARTKVIKRDGAMHQCTLPRVSPLQMAELLGATSYLAGLSINHLCMAWPTYLVHDVQKNPVGPTYKWKSQSVILGLSLQRLLG